MGRTIRYLPATATHRAIRLVPTVRTRRRPNIAAGRGQSSSAASARDRVPTFGLAGARVGTPVPLPSSTS
jgi:hypothetical protein